MAGGYYDVSTRKYHFYMTDHLGTNRVVANQDGVVVRKTHYYPFGLSFADGTGQGAQPYKYTGKEYDKMHGLNLYDYSARQYDPALGRFTSIDPLAEKYYSISPYVYAGNNPIRNIDINGDSITVTTKSGEYLFMLDDGETTMTTYKAKQLYDKGIQWFAPEADNYMGIIGMSETLGSSEALKHFSSDEIMAFAEEDRWMISYRQGGSGDWKKSKRGADGYLMVTVDGKPYWADAVGQIPFTIDHYTDVLLKTGSVDKAKSQTIEGGKKYGDGGLINPTADNANSYDNAMITRTVNWASKNYSLGRSIFANRVIMKNNNYNPRSLFNY